MTSSLNYIVACNVCLVRWLVCTRPNSTLYIISANAFFTTFPNMSLSFVNSFLQKLRNNNKTRSDSFSSRSYLLDCEERQAQVFAKEKTLDYNGVVCSDTKVKRQGKVSRLQTSCGSFEKIGPSESVGLYSIQEKAYPSKTQGVRFKDESTPRPTKRGWGQRGKLIVTRLLNSDGSPKPPLEVLKSKTPTSSFDMTDRKTAFDSDTESIKSKILQKHTNTDIEAECSYSTHKSKPENAFTRSTRSFNDTTSPLFEEENRTSLFPIRYIDIWDMYKKAVASFWTIDEIDMSTDAYDWQLLNGKEKSYITRVLIFFLGADRLVNDNLLDRFTQSVKMFECLYFYQFQMAIENVHTETYNMLIETFVTDEFERDALFKSVEGYRSIAEKYDWCRRWTNDETLSFSHRLVAFACVEGIFFSSSFAAIFWLKKRGLLKGLCFSNEMISRDEGLHCDFAVLLFNNYCPPIPVQEVRKIVSESCSIEKVFVKESMPTDLVGIDVDGMCKYVDYISERLMIDLTGERLNPGTALPCNPLDFMENITLQGKTNFFERKVSEYRVAGEKM